METEDETEDNPFGKDFDFSPYKDIQEYEYFEQPSVRNAILRANYSDHNPKSERHSVVVYKNYFPDAPAIENIHQRLLAAISGPGRLEDYGMSCNEDSELCRACWVVAISGETGIELAKKAGAPAAALAIYGMSDPSLIEAPLLHLDKVMMREDILRCANDERQKSGKRKILSLNHSDVTYVRGPTSDDPFVYRERGRRRIHVENISTKYQKNGGIIWRPLLKGEDNCFVPSYWAAERNKVLRLIKFHPSQIRSKNSIVVDEGYNLHHYRNDLPVTPKIKNIHSTVYSHATTRLLLSQILNFAPVNQLNTIDIVMSITGRQGLELANQMGVADAVRCIYAASDPNLRYAPELRLPLPDAFINLEWFAKRENRRSYLLS